MLLFKSEHNFNCATHGDSINVLQTGRRKIVRSIVVILQIMCIFERGNMVIFDKMW